MCANVDALQSATSPRRLPRPDMYSYESINQVAVDWAANNWYLLDDTREIILLCSHKLLDLEGELDRMLCKTILSVQLSKPRGIALDPNEGVMFFTVWGTTSPKLERASLDGQNRKVLVNSKIVYPYGVTVDFPTKTVYWVDTYLDYIECIDYDGNNRKTVLRGSPVQNLYSIVVFENNLYVTSWRNNSILRVNKFHPENRATLLDGLQRPFAIQVFHRQRQPLNYDDRSGHPCQRRSPYQCNHVSATSCILQNFFSCSCSVLVFLA